MSNHATSTPVNFLPIIKYINIREIAIEMNDSISRLQKYEKQISFPIYVLLLMLQKHHTTTMQ